MVGASTGRFLDVRPSLSRTRSSSSPMTRETAEEDVPTKPGVTRPGHFRSRSYISPVEKPVTASTFPLSTSSEKQSEPSRFPRLHLPGKHHHTQSEDQKPTVTQKRHRYTQSDAQQHHRHHDDIKRSEGGHGLHNYIIGHDNPNATHLPYPGSRGAMIPSLARMASYRSTTLTNDLAASAYTFADTRLHQIDTNRTLQPTTIRKQTSLEKLLDRTASRPPLPPPTPQTLATLTQSLTLARSELSSRLLTTSRSASTLMRRLDSAHSTLHLTAESLTDTISSFTQLHTQSNKLLSNFSTETTHLDTTLRSRISRFRSTIHVDRTRRIGSLETRGRRVTEKAENLGRRLENCRTIIGNWERREQNKRRTWRGVRNGVAWGLLVILLAVTVGVLASKTASYTDRLRPGVQNFDVQSADNSGKGSGRGNKVVSTANETRYIEELQDANVPEDVVLVLRDIARRQKGEENAGVGEEGDGSGLTQVKEATEAATQVDRRFRLLDEL